jgi:putative hydrolase of the HAD superfamily
LEHDAIHTLAAIRRGGYRLGAISNTSDDKNVQQLIDRWGLRGYFEQIVTSAGCGIRKPDPAIFRLALDHFRVRPRAAAMIGDTPEADIMGANGLGMYAIWITRRSEKTDPAPARPDAVVRTLEEVPGALAAAR